MKPLSYFTILLKSQSAYSSYTARVFHDPWSYATTYFFPDPYNLNENILNNSHKILDEALVFLVSLTCKKHPLFSL